MERIDGESVFARESGPHLRTHVLGEGISTTLNVGARRPEGSRSFKHSLVTGTGPPLPDDGMIRPVVLVPKGGRLSPSRRPLEAAAHDAEHQDNLKRAHMRSLRAAVAREKHGGPGRSIRPRPAPPVMDHAAAAPPLKPRAPSPQHAAAEGRASASAPALAESRSPRTNNGRGNTREAGNGFFGATGDGPRRSARTGRAPAPSSRPATEHAPCPVQSLQFAADAAPPAREPPQILTIQREGSGVASATQIKTQGSGAPLGPASSVASIFAAAVGAGPPPTINLDLSETWNRNSALSKGLYKRAGTYTPDEESRLSFAHQYNEALRQLKDKLQSKGRENFMGSFDRFRKNMDDPQEVDGRALRAALKDMNLTFSDDVLALLCANAGAGPSGKVNYRRLTDDLQWNRLNYVSMKVNAGRYRALAAPDPAQPLGDSSVKNTPFYRATLTDGRTAEGLTCTPLDKMSARIDALEGALRRHDADNDGRVSYKEFYAALQEVSRAQRLHLGDQEILELFRDTDQGMTSSIDIEPLLRRARNGSFPEILRPRKERASMPQPPWKFVESES